ncbi:MAG: histidine kinase [Alphaproteobacteria bacterium]|jgi:two-component system sensor histidine kinase ChvG|nr:histidine kinase [Alphaproteobacteria bacterium]
MLPLALLAGGVIFLGQYEDELIEGELTALRVQAEMVAAGLGEGATRGVSANEERIDTELARQMVVRLVQPTGVRARLFVTTGELIADSLTLPGLGAQRIEVSELPPAREPSWTDKIDEFQEWVDQLLEYRRRTYTIYSESAVQVARDYQEVTLALRGNTTSAIRTDRGDRRIMSVAVPVQRYKEVLGALMLSHDDRKVGASLRQVRLDILKVAGISLLATILLSLYLAGTITQPVRRLAAAAARVRSNDGTKPSIPDLTERRDEIGDLSSALREMTEALWKRMNAIERFAADVAHELKNPLTSLRSAVETAARVENPEQRNKLMSIVLDDVNRLNRLISDISDASRLDAELMRADLQPVDINRLLNEMIDIYRSAQLQKLDVAIELVVQGKGPFRAQGHDGRLGQVFRNLIDNALSFSPPGGVISLTLSRDGGSVIAMIEDQGPGIPDNKLEAVFSRFYSERPQGEQFGKHSGLGLSIARQIVETYRGTIIAANRRDDRGNVQGARFTVMLPAI